MNENDEGVPLISDTFAANSKKQTFVVNHNSFNRASQRYEDDEFFDEDEDEENKKLKIELFNNISTGDPNKVERSLNNGALPNATCFENRVTACHFAAFLGHLEILQALVKRGADAEKKDMKDRTPLDFAIWNGHEDCVRELIKISRESEETQQKETDGDAFKNIYISKTLIKLPIEINDIWSDSTPVHLASARTHAHIIRLLIGEGFEGKPSDANDNTPLDICGEGWRINGKLEISHEKFESTVKELIKYEDLKYKPALNRRQSNPLHKAVNMNSKEAVKIMVDVAAYRNGYDTSGQTPLHDTITGKKKNMLSIFLFVPNSAENDLDFSNDDGLTPLCVAIKIKWKKGMAMLLKAGASVLIKDKNGDNALHIAAAAGTPSILQDILNVMSDKSAQLDIKNKAGETALFKAIKSGDERRVNILLEENASIKEKLLLDFNVLHIATMYNHTKILKLLLAKNSTLLQEEQVINDQCSPTCGGMTAVHMAADQNRLDCLKIFVEFNADLRVKTLNTAYTPLHLAAINGHLKIITYLMEIDCSLAEVRDAEKWKPFYRAVRKGHRDCTTYFLKRGADFSEVLEHRRKKGTVMELLTNNMPRSTSYLEELFDSFISKNDYEITDERCEILIDYSVLMPISESKNVENKVSDHQMDVVVSILNTNRRMRQRDLLLHPYIESFLYMKWMNGLRTFYAVLVAMFIMYVASLTLTVLIIYNPNNDPVQRISTTLLLSIFIGLLALQEILFISVLLIKDKLKCYFRRKIGFFNWTSIALSISVLIIDHSIEDRNWPKIITAAAILIAWLQVAIVLSHFPECGYTLQMFTTVASRALKVIALFGIYVIVGFALAFWILFHGQTSFDNAMDSFMRTIVMTSEFDYVSLFEAFDPTYYRLFIQLVFVVFIFFVPIVMMNLILALIISDTKDLEMKGKSKRLIGQVHLINILDSVAHVLLRSRMKQINRTCKIYPGRPAWESISLVSKNLEESLFSRVNRN